MKKTILITGATRGIGLELAKQALMLGYHVIINGRNEQILKKRKAQLLKIDPNAQIDYVVFDVCDRLAIKRATKKIYRLDVLINNAGIVADNWFNNLSFDDWDSVIETNLTGAFNVTHAFSKYLNTNGHIVMITSRAAIFGNKGQANYAASKAGIIGFTKTLAKELSYFDLYVNAVSPAAKTDMTLPALKKVKKRLGKIPKEWQLGTVEEVSDFILNKVVVTNKTGMVYGVNGTKIGYFTDPVFTPLT